jgi:hypothetical protein
MTQLETISDAEQVYSFLIDLQLGPSEKVSHESSFKLEFTIDYTGTRPIVSHHKSRRLLVK